MKPPAARVTRSGVTAADAVFVLENGARMNQESFHALYLRTPPGFKAELIGVVYVMSSPVSLRHGRPHARVVQWLCNYSDETPGTAVGDDTTSVLGDESEPQPDALMILEPEVGGQTTADPNGYIVGPPELAAEVAHSTASIDLNAKKADYEKAGVSEYVVFLVREQAVRWFVRRKDRFEELAAGPGGVLRSETFPGLWLDPAAFFERLPRRHHATARQGLAGPEHAAFVAELEAQRTARSKKKPAAKKPPRKSK